MYCPVEGIEGEDTDVLFKVAIATTRRKELNQFWNVTSKKRRLLHILHEKRIEDAKHAAYQDQKGFQNVEELTGSLLVASLHTLANDGDHTREKCLERSLYEKW